MSKRDKRTSRPGAAEPPKRGNPGIEVVNIYGSGPVPVGLRSEAEPVAEDPGRQDPPVPDKAKLDRAQPTDSAPDEK